MIKTNKIMSKEELEYLRNDVVVDNLNNIRKEIDKLNQKVRLTFEVLLEVNQTIRKMDYDRRLAIQEEKTKRENTDLEYLRNDRDYVWRRTDDLRDAMNDIDRHAERCGMPCETREAVD